MKKLFAPLLLFAIIILLFSSCSNSSKLSFSKRHYRSGYFADISSKNHTVPVSQATIHPIAPIAIAKSENPVIANTSTVSTQKTNVAGNSVKENTSINIAANATNQVLNKTLNGEQGPIVQNKQAISESTGLQGDDANAAGAALSLLWIVIVIILIFWLIGILAGGFGLGGLINVLLVIALILLILWLLRIW